MKRRKQLWLCALMIVGLVLGSVQVQAKDLLDRLPAETVLCVRLNGLDSTLNQLDQFLMGVAPFSVGMMAKMQLGGMLGNMQLQGLNNQGALSLVVLKSSQGMSGALLVPVTDFQGFATSSTSLTAGATEGVYEMVGPKGQKFSIADAGDGYALFVPSMLQGQISGLKQQLKGSDKSLASNLDAPDKKRAGKDPIWVYINTPLVGKLIAPMVEQNLNMAKMMMGDSGEETAQAMDTAGAAGKQFFEQLSKESRYATVSLAPSAQQLGLDVAIQTVAGSDMAKKMTRSGAKRDTSLLSYLQSDAVLNYSGNLVAKMMKDVDLDELAQACPDMDKEELKKITTLADKIGAQFNGTDALSLHVNPSQAPFVSIQYVAQVKDGKAVSGLFDEMTQLLKGYLEAEDLKLSMNRGASEYQGVKIDEGSVTLPESDDVPVESVSFHSACTDKMYVLSLGLNPDQGVKKLIDKTKGQGQSSNSITNVLKALPKSDEADMVVAMNLVQIAMKAMTQSNASLPTSSGMAAMVKADDGQGTFSLVLPKAHVQEIMTAVMQAMMQKNQQ